MRIVKQQDRAQWNLLHNNVASHIDAFCSDTDDNFIPALHECIRVPVQHAFPNSQRTLSKPPPISSIDIHNKWRHRRLALARVTDTLFDCFHRWYHWGRFLCLQRQQKRRLQTVKKQRFWDLMQDVQQAACRHDSFSMFQIINRYSPRQPKKQIRLRNHNGTPASPSDVLSLTQAYIADLWQGPSIVSYRHLMPPNIPFSLEDLEWELRHIPMTKSVARPFLPGIILCQHCQRLAELQPEAC